MKIIRIMFYGFLGILIGLILLLLGNMLGNTRFHPKRYKSFSFNLDSKEKAALDSADDFVDLILDKNFKKAYDRTTNNFQARINFDEFKNQVEKEMLEYECVATNPITEEFKREKYVVKVIIYKNIKNDERFEYLLKVVLDKDDWKIDEFNLFH